MRLTQKGKITILTASVVCIVCFTYYTILHIMFYNEVIPSSLDVLSDHTLRVGFKITEISSYFSALSLLILLYYSIKKAYINYKRQVRYKFFICSTFLYLIYLLFYNPIGLLFLYRHPIIVTYVIFWNIVHFIVIVYTIIFILKTLGE